jgi:hypothetical protein
MRKAVAASADEIVQLQKKLAPIDDGDLQMSITWRWGNEKKVAYSQSMGTVFGRTDLSAVITVGNTKVRYAHLVEFETAPHINAGKFPGTQHPGTKKQAFFYPGWRLGKKRAKARIRRAITKAAKEVASS